LIGHCFHRIDLLAREALGWAVGEAKPVDIARQRFEGGMMIWRSDRDEIMVLSQSEEGFPFTVYPD
jgi:hypothetical protein